MLALIGITGASLGYSAKNVIREKNKNKKSIPTRTYNCVLHNVLKLTAGVVGSYVGDLDDVGSMVGDSVGDIGAGVTGDPVAGAAVVGVNVGRSVSGDLVGTGRVGL